MHDEAERDISVPGGLWIISHGNYGLFDVMMNPAFRVAASPTHEAMHRRRNDTIERALRAAGKAG